MGRPKKSAAAAVLLPDDALVEILSRLPAKSLFRFKCVSTAWRDLIADRLRCTNLPQTLEGFFYYSDGEIHGGGIDSEDDASPVIHERFINTLGKPAPLASLSFLGNVPGIQEFGLLRSCNGLLLFTHRNTYNSLGYLVCNPATEQWVAVHSSGWKPHNLYPSHHEREDSYFDPDPQPNCCFTYLVFDPAMSPHFQLVEFWTDGTVTVEEVHTYSSETGVWCKRTSQWSGEAVGFDTEAGFASGMLHLSATRIVNWQIDHELIVAVDGEGKNRRIIRCPEKHADVAFVGQSQGRLHCMNRHRDKDNNELYIWVLEDYDAEEWVLKHSVTFLQLFGRSCRSHSDFSVIAIHPDRNLIFFFQHWDLKLISCDMDSLEVCTLRTLGANCQNILPYVPYFGESPALASKRCYCGF